MITKSTANDIPTLIRIAQNSFSVPWAGASFEAEFIKNHSHVLMYRTGVPEVPVGYIIVWIIYDEGEIASLAVDKGWRGKGVGAALVEHIFHQYPEVKKWSLEVDPQNIPAMKLYEKKGFKRVRVIKNYYGQGNDAVQMVKSVNH